MKRNVFINVTSCDYILTAQSRLINNDQLMPVIVAFLVVH